MKRIIILSSALVFLTSYSANAQISVILGNPQPLYYQQPVPGYVMAPDWPSEHYDFHRHRHNDYWARKNQEERDHREHEDHDRGNNNEHDSHDNGNHDRR